MRHMSSALTLQVDLLKMSAYIISKQLRHHQPLVRALLCSEYFLFA